MAIPRRNKFLRILANDFMKTTKDKEPGMIERIKGRFKTDINNKVILNFDALVKATTYYGVTIKTQGSKEIMGWLVGNREGKNIEVVDAWIGDCKSSSTYTQLDAAETVRMKKLARAKGLSLVGQWHIHPNMSTNPSSEDKNTMVTLEKWGMKNPIMMIVNSNNFWFGTIEKGHMKRVDFIVPPKTDNNLDITLGYINGEYRSSMFDVCQSGYPVGAVGFMEGKTVRAYYGMVGNYFLLGLDIILPFLRLKKWVDWSE